MSEPLRHSERIQLAANLTTLLQYFGITPPIILSFLLGGVALVSAYKHQEQAAVNDVSAPAMSGRAGAYGAPAASKSLSGGSYDPANHPCFMEALDRVGPIEYNRAAFFDYVGKCLQRGR